MLCEKGLSVLLLLFPCDLEESRIKRCWILVFEQTQQNDIYE